MNYYKHAMRVMSHEIPPPYKREIRVLLDESDGLAGATAALSIVAPKSSTGRHVHEESDEVMYVMSGQGRGSVTDVEFPVESDVIFWAPRGSYHQIENDSDEPMRVLAFYVPAASSDLIRRSLEAANYTSPE